MAEQGATMAEGDEPNEPAADNSTGRLLALSDGVFAIAMTLLALDLRLPDLGDDTSDAQLRHALGDDWRGYLAFVISFYVVANYWSVHRRAMRAVTTIDSRLISHTLALLLLVRAALPASVLATYGDLPTALAFYCAFNVVANLALIRVLTDVQARPPDAAEIEQRERVWANNPRPAGVHPWRLRTAEQRAVARAAAHRLRARSADPPGTPRGARVTADPGQSLAELSTRQGSVLLAIACRGMKLLFEGSGGVRRRA